MVQNYFSVRHHHNNIEGGGDLQYTAYHREQRSTSSNWDLPHYPKWNECIDCSPDTGSNKWCAIHRHYLFILTRPAAMSSWIKSASRSCRARDCESVVKCRPTVLTNKKSLQGQTVYLAELHLGFVVVAPDNGTAWDVCLVSEVDFLQRADRATLLNLHTEVGLTKVKQCIAE